MKTRVILTVMLVAVIGLGACKNKSDDRSSNKNVLSIVLEPGKIPVCNGGCNGKSGSEFVQISVQVCKTQVVTSLDAVFTFEDPKTTVSPTGPQDFTTPQTYTVTAENGSQREYTITVTKGTFSCGSGE